MKRTIRDLELEGKKVIIRVDFNVPIKNGVITDDNRIKEALPTINYAVENAAKVILMSHLGRVEKEEDKEKNSLLIVAKHLSKLLSKEVIFSENTVGHELEKTINNMKEKDVLLIENTRFEDIDNKKESKNNDILGKYWASLGDVYINDAFGTAHRAHASNVGIASNLPNAVGFLIEKELNCLEQTMKNPKRPFTVILGGAKVSDKIGVLENLVNKADYILIGGAMAFTFLKSEGFEIGSSLLDEDSIDFCKKILKEHKDKIILPVDVKTGLSIEEGTTIKTRLINEIKKDEIGLDIGEKTIKLFTNYIDQSNTIIWNGPVGMFELKDFVSGTMGLFEALKRANKTTIIGGGDTAAAAIRMGYKDTFTHISTGGGAALELLEGKNLPGIVIIDEK